MAAGWTQASGTPAPFSPQGPQSMGSPQLALGSSGSGMFTVEPALHDQALWTQAIMALIKVLVSVFRRLATAEHGCHEAVRSAARERWVMGTKLEA